MNQTVTVLKRSHVQVVSKAGATKVNVNAVLNLCRVYAAIGESAENGSGPAQRLLESRGPPPAIVSFHHSSLHLPAVLHALYAMCYPSN